MSVLPSSVVLIPDLEGCLVCAEAKEQTSRQRILALRDLFINVSRVASRFDVTNLLSQRGTSALSAVQHNHVLFKLKLTDLATAHQGLSPLAPLIGLLWVVAESGSLCEWQVSLSVFSVIWQRFNTAVRHGGILWLLPVPGGSLFPDVWLRRWGLTCTAPEPMQSHC